MRSSIRAVALLVAAVSMFSVVTASAKSATFSGTVAAGGGDWNTHLVQVNATGTIRGVLDWNNAGANLNLLLYDPTGTLVVSARSTTAKPEIVQYQAQRTGSYKLGVKAKSGSASYTLAVDYPDDPAPPPPSELGAAVEAGVYEETRTWGANVADYDADGHDDFLLVRHSQAPARLYHNQGDGTFIEVNRGTFPRNDRHDCAWGDVDQDGRLDAYCTLGADHGTGTGLNELWMQQPDGTFVNRASAYGVTDPFGRGRHATFVDVDHDPYPDLFVGNHYPRTDGRTSPNRLYINQGGTSFRDAPEFGLDKEVGGYCAQAADYDGDGWEDLLVCGRKALKLYRNDGGVIYRDVSLSVGIDGFWRGAVLADFDGDGRPDLARVRPGSVQVRLQRSGTFTTQVLGRSLDAGRDLAAGDLDGDGDLDLYVLQGADGTVNNRPDLMLLNDGAGTAFTQTAIPLTTRGRGDAVASIDRDGDDADEFIVLNGEGSASGPIQLIT